MPPCEGCNCSAVEACGPKETYTYDEVSQIVQGFEETSSLHNEIEFELNKKLTMSRQALEYVYKLYPSKVVKDVLDQLEIMETCPIHKINYKDCDC